MDEFEEANYWINLINSLESLPKGPAEKILEVKKENWFPSARERWGFLSHNIRYLFHRYDEIEKTKEFALMEEYLNIVDAKGNTLAWTEGGGFFSCRASAFHALEWELYRFATKTKEEDLPINVELRVLGYKDINYDGRKLH